MHTLKVTKTISAQCVADILTTAVEGGIAYWANDYRGVDWTRDALGTDCRVGYVTEFRIGNPLPDAECDVKPKRRKVGAREIVRALQWLQDAPSDDSIPSHAKAGADYVAEIIGHCLPDGFEGDAGEADIVLQVAVFGRIIYG